MGFADGETHLDGLAEADLVGVEVTSGPTLERSFQHG